MPQELRWPEFRTDQASEEVIKSMNSYRWLSSQSILSRGSEVQNIALQASWPDMTELEANLFLTGLEEQDLIYMEQEDGS